MKITSEILQAMDFVKEQKSYTLRLHGYNFTLVKDAEFNSWSFSCNGDILHSVTDVEELVAFALGDGYDIGFKDCKKEIRKFLEIK